MPAGDDKLARMTPAQLHTFRRLLLFAIFLAIVDVLVIGVLFYLGMIALPW